ncbi:hypothetical protein ACFWFU_12705 [Streptomyces sp. NPDC060235]|uniref:hypothetical protein n=1 Tax=Streptomyces sp. NPDC060235 TaxID=3347080 RepID=UPI0036501E97
MLTEQAQHALKLLYRRADKTGDAFDLERIDRALDEIIRLNANAPAAFQIRSALAHAGTVLRERRALAPAIPLDETDSYREPGALDEHFGVTDIRAWLDTTEALTASQRSLLQQLSADRDPSDLAVERGLSIARMREQVSRARRRARIAYAAEVVPA